MQSILQAAEAVRGLSVTGRNPCALPAQAYASRWMEAQAEGRAPPPLSEGFTYELTAGIVDKSKTLEEIAKEEVCSPENVSNATAPLSTSNGFVTTSSYAARTSGNGLHCRTTLSLGLSASPKQHHSRVASSPGAGTAALICPCRCSRRWAMTSRWRTYGR